MKYERIYPLQCEQIIKYVTHSAKGAQRSREDQDPDNWRTSSSGFFFNQFVNVFDFFHIVGRLSYQNII